MNPLPVESQQSLSKSLKRSPCLFELNSHLYYLGAVGICENLAHQLKNAAQDGTNGLQYFYDNWFVTSAQTLDVSPVKKFMILRDGEFEISRCPVPIFFPVSKVVRNFILTTEMKVYQLEYPYALLKDTGNAHGSGGISRLSPNIARKPLISMVTDIIETGDLLFFTGLSEILVLHSSEQSCTIYLPGHLLQAVTMCDYITTDGTQVIGVCMLVDVSQAGGVPQSDKLIFAYFSRDSSGIKLESFALAPRIGTHISYCCYSDPGFLILQLGESKTHIFCISVTGQLYQAQKEEHLPPNILNSVVFKQIDWKPLGAITGQRPHLLVNLPHDSSILAGSQSLKGHWYHVDPVFTSTTRKIGVRHLEHCHYIQTSFGYSIWYDNDSGEIFLEKSTTSLNKEWLKDYGDRNGKFGTSRDYWRNFDKHSTPYKLINL